MIGEDLNYILQNTSLTCVNKLKHQRTEQIHSCFSNLFLFKVNENSFDVEVFCAHSNESENLLFLSIFHPSYPYSIAKNFPVIF